MGAQALRLSVTAAFRRNAVWGRCFLSVRACCPFIIAFMAVLFLPTTLFSEGGSSENPDLQVEGFAVFGTNTTGSTSVTSGWGSVYIDGSLQVGSNLHINGSINSTNVAVFNRVSLSIRDQVISDGGTIDPVSSYMRVRGDVTAVTLGNPQISAGTPGQLLTLQGVANSVAVTLVNSNGLRTKLTQPFRLGTYDTIQFVYDESNGVWVEINRSNNRIDN